MTNFGSIIHDARTKKSLTLAELASKTGYSSQYLCDIEKGYREPSSGILIEKLSSKLDISSDILYFYAGKIPRDIKNIEASDEQILEAFRAFRDALIDNDEQSLYVELPSETRYIKANIVRLGEAMPLED